MPPLASFPDLEAWLGDSLDAVRGQAVLDNASAQVRAAAGRTWVDEANALVDVPADIRALVVRLAARMYANPTGSRQESAGPFSRSLGDGLLTDDETGVIGRYRPSSGLGVISTTRGRIETRFVDVQGSDKPLPEGII